MQPVNVTRASLRTTCNWPHDIEANGMPTSETITSGLLLVRHFLNKKSGRSLLWKLCHRTTELRLRVKRTEKWLFYEFILASFTREYSLCFDFMIELFVAIRFDACRTARSEASAFERFLVLLRFFAQIQWTAAWHFRRFHFTVGSECARFAEIFSISREHLMALGIGECANVFDFAAFLQESFGSRWPFLRYTRAAETTATGLLASVAAIRRRFIAWFQVTTQTGIVREKMQRTASIRLRVLLETVMWCIMSRTQSIRTQFIAREIRNHFQFIIVDRQ